MTGPDDFGPKPDLIWVETAQCHVDKAYQRSIESRASQKLIEKIAAEFTWPKFGTLILVKGITDYLIIDGQHRTEGAKRRKVQKVPAALYPTVSKAQQARYFVDANRDRVAMNQFAVHHALVISGDVAARTMQQICDEAGVEIPRSQVPLISMKPGQTMALASIRSVIHQHGGAVSLSVLKTLAGAFKEPGGLRAHLILGLAALVRQQQTLSLAKVQRAMRETGIDQIERQIVAWCQDHGTTRHDAAAHVINKISGGAPIQLVRAARVNAMTGFQSSVSHPGSTGAPKKAAKKSIAPAKMADTKATVTKRIPTGAGLAPKPKSGSRDDQAEIERHIKIKGVTRCPPAAVAATQANPGSKLPDRIAIEKEAARTRFQSKEQLRRQQFEAIGSAQRKRGK